MRIAGTLLFVFCVISISACSDKNSDWKQTIPVRGVIYVDGEAASGVAVTLHPTGGIDKQQPTASSAVSDEKGNFSVSTYQQGDGAPAGEYAVTFSWGKLDPISMSYKGDELKGRYENPEKTEFKVNVEAKPVDMGRIELTRE